MQARPHPSWKRAPQAALQTSEYEGPVVSGLVATDRVFPRIGTSAVGGKIKVLPFKTPVSYTHL